MSGNKTSNKSLLVFLILLLSLFSAGITHAGEFDRKVYASVVKTPVKASAATEFLPYTWNDNGNDSSCVLIVDKSRQRLHVYHGLNLSKKIREYRCSTGKALGDKKARGDLKTPEGVYQFVDVLEDDHLEPKYGVRAFVMDYPNPIDRILGKSGSGIWLHATDNPERHLQPRDTEGCVVVSNEDILDLSQHIELNETHMIIVDSIKQKQAKPKYDAGAFVEKWKSSWESEKIDTYMSHYFQGFNSNKGNYDEWKAYKSNLFKLYTNITVKCSNIKFISSGKTARIIFDQRFRSDQFQGDHGRKVLFLIKVEDDWKIINERWSSYAKKLNTSKK